MVAESLVQRVLPEGSFQVVVVLPEGVDQLVLLEGLVQRTPSNGDALHLLDDVLPYGIVAPPFCALCRSQA